MDDLDVVMAGNRTQKLERDMSEMKSLMQANTLTVGLQRIEEAINGLQADGMPIDNLDEIKKYLRDEFARFASQLTVAMRDAVAKVSYEIKIPENIKIDNYQELAKTLKRLEKFLEEKDWNPNINISVPDVIVPEIKVPRIDLPTINVPEAKAPIVNIDLNDLLRALQPLKFLSNKATSPIAVRMTDGQKFVKAIKDLTDTAQRQMTVFSNASGMTKDEYKIAQRELNQSYTATNTSATVGIASSVVVTAKNRISCVLTNDSDSVIYLAKGDTAELNKGIRLNALGGAYVVEDWNGAISAISSGANKNICISETSANA
jgi:hypothetical protein